MADETYHPTSTHPQPSGLEPRTFFSGSGAPTSTAGIPPNSLWLDEDSGDIYRLEDGAWVSVVTGGGGGGGSTEVFSLAGAAAPVTIPSGAGIAYNGSGNLWIYTALGWEQRF